jgi:tetrahydromethanopterin S-methyltransferase subunit G
MVDGLRKENNVRMEKIEKRIDTVEDKTANLLGKIGIGVIVLSAIISSFFAMIVNWFKIRI